MNAYHPKKSSIWHPCSQMKDYETFAPIEITHAKDCYLYLSDDSKMIDAISSWWCKLLGHNHSELKHALLEQVHKFEHVILANTTNTPIQNLSNKLASLTGLQKVAYASDGSCAVEMALKMSLHARVNAGDFKKNQFIALQNAYHGETIGTLSVSDLGLYNRAYEALMFKTHFLNPLPYVTGTDDPLWQDAEVAFNKILPQLEALADNTTAIIVEPLLQGAGGMHVYSADFLKRLANFAKSHDIHLIADEIMTGIARTGKMFAFEYADIQPDFVCLGKNLTSGWLPLSVVVTSDEMYFAFYHDYAEQKNFLHSHTFSGNALAVSVALKNLELIEAENFCTKANDIGRSMKQHFILMQESGLPINNIRQLGAMVAADLISTKPRAGYEVYQTAVKMGALLRPLGNTLYWLPPLIITEAILTDLKDITQKAIELSLCPGTIA